MSHSRPVDRHGLLRVVEVGQSRRAGQRAAQLGVLRHLPRGARHRRDQPVALLDGRDMTPGQAAGVHRVVVQGVRDDDDGPCADQRLQDDQRVLRPPDVRGEADVVEQRGPEQLVPHVGGQGVGEQSERRLASRHAPRGDADARAVRLLADGLDPVGAQHHVGLRPGARPGIRFPAGRGPVHGGEELGAVGVVGVDEGDPPAAGGLEPLVADRRHPAVDRVVEDPHAGVRAARQEPGDAVGGVVGGRVDQDEELEVPVGLGQDGADRVDNPFAGVVDGHNDRGSRCSRRVRHEPSWEQCRA